MSRLRLEGDSQNPLMLHVIWGEEWVQTVCKSLFVSRLSCLQECKEKEEFLAKFREIEVQAARAEGVRLLARKARFGRELKQRLMLRGISEVAAGQTVRYFEQKGYIHDGNRAENLVHQELRKGHGPQYIFQMLKHKKIASDEIARLRPLIEKGENQSLQAFLKKRSSTLKEKDRKKLISQLLRRGYSYEAIQKAVD